MALAMLDCSTGAALVLGSHIFTMEHRSYREMLPMSVGADSPVTGLVGNACWPQWTHAGGRLTGLSLGEGMLGPLQIAGQDVSC